MGDNTFSEKPLNRFLKRFLHGLRTRLTDSQRFLILSIIVGVSCGLAAVGFILAIIWLSDLVLRFPASQSDSIFVWLTLPLIPAAGGLMVGIGVTRFSPSTRGSGIPQVKEAYYNKFGLIRIRDGIFRFILTALSIGFGNSLGREGPTVHICAAIGSTVGQWFGLTRARIQAMVPVGMGAGIAAGFNTPLAAITFVFEKLLDDFSSKALGGILIAVIVASVISRAILGENPAFEVEHYSFESYSWIPLSVLIGLMAAAFGHSFVGLLLQLRAYFLSNTLPRWFQPCLGGLGVGILGTLVLWFSQSANTGVFGTGYIDLSAALKGSLVLKILIFLFVGKFLASIIAFSMGGSGGLFGPVLCIGGMLGGIIGALFNAYMGLDQSVVGAAALLGMGAFFAAAIRCPLTSVLIPFEMTLNYSLILPLMVANMIAYGLAARWRPVAIYNAILLQDKVTLKKMPSYQGAQDWRNLPVSAIMNHDPFSAFSNLSVRENLEYLRQHPHHAYPVRDENRLLINVITHQELEGFKGDQSTLLGELLTEHPLVTMTPNTSIREAARLLVTSDKEQAPVVSPKNPQRIVGFLTLRDIARQQNAIDEQVGH